jgi:hypothetical protein
MQLRCLLGAATHTSSPFCPHSCGVAETLTICPSSSLPSDCSTSAGSMLAIQLPRLLSMGPPELAAALLPQRKKCAASRPDNHRALGRASILGHLCSMGMLSLVEMPPTLSEPLTGFIASIGVFTSPLHVR